MPKLAGAILCVSPKSSLEDAYVWLMKSASF
jgi:hypothetical protein